MRPMAFKELWVIAAEARLANVFRRTGPEGYTERTEVRSGETLVVPFARDLGVVLGGLTLA